MGVERHLASHEQAIAEAIRQIAARPDVAVIFPVHLNPNVRAVMNAALGDLDNVALIEPLDYPHFVRLLSIAEIMLTDRGVTAGTAKLVGTETANIVTEIFNLLGDKAAYENMAQAHNPFGDGHSARRIVELLGNEIRR